MDEPTAALSDNEVTVLYRVIDALKAKGVAIIYVSHRLQEIFDLCDVITVLKDGALVTSRPRAELDHAGLVRAMVGRPIGAFFPDPEPDTEVGPPVLTVTAGGNEQPDGIDLELRAGEILGISGLQGSGRTELDRCPGHEPTASRTRPCRPRPGHGGQADRRVLPGPRARHRGRSARSHRHRRRQRTARRHRSRAAGR